MRRIVLWMAAGAALLAGPGGPAPLAAQCMACVSSSGCGPSTSRGNCSAQCLGTVCACSDNACRPGITAAPAETAHGTRFAAAGETARPESDAFGVLVRYCDGQVELLVYAADGTRLIESRLLALPSESPPARLAHVEAGPAAVGAPGDHALSR